MKIEFELDDQYAAKMGFILAENHSHGGKLTPNDAALTMIKAVLDDDNEAHKEFPVS